MSLNITGGTITSASAAQENSEEEQPDSGDEPPEKDGNREPAGDAQSAPTQGGGIMVEENAKLTLNGTKVTGNTADQGGGIYAAPGAEIELKNGAEASGNEGDDVYLDYGKTGYYADDGEEIVDGAKVNTPRGGSWTDDSGKSHSGTVESDGEGLSLKWKPADTSGSASGSSSSSDTPNDSPSDTPNEVEITDLDVPMAEGPISCAEFIYKLWLLDGEPAPLGDRGLLETVSKDHEYAQAIAWAVSADVVSVETFDPEELLTMDMARGFLANFAAYADMVMPELTTLTGNDDDLVLNADDVLAEFFGRELDA